MNGEMLLHHSSPGVTFSFPQSVHTAISQQVFWNIYCGNYMANYLFIDSMHFLEIHLQDKLLHKVPVHWLTSIVNATWPLGTSAGLQDVRSESSSVSTIFGIETMLELLQTWDIPFTGSEREKGRVLKNPTDSEHPGPDLVKPYSFRLHLIRLYLKTHYFSLHLEVQVLCTTLKGSFRHIQPFHGSYDGTILWI